MSISDSNKAITKINEKINSTFITPDTNVYFILGMPISDIGKGTLVAHLLSMLPDSDAIKFDGLLNTNANGRHTAEGHDDFGIYEKYNKGKKFGDSKYILGGHLFREFIDLYGEYENLCFRPHFFLYFVSKILEIWKDIGKPKNYLFEIGGTIIDYEVDAYIPPVIYYFKQRLGERCKIILLTEIGYNNKYAKTRSIQRAVEEFAKRFILPDIILAREPKNMPPLSPQEREANEIDISARIHERIGIKVSAEKIVCVPFFDQDSIDKLGEYYQQRLPQLLVNNKSIFVGTTNPSKIADWKNLLSGYTVVEPTELSVHVNVEEGTQSLRENAEKKAIAWAHASNMVTISDDTGFFINALEGKPGVAVKRWGGEFNDELTNKEFIAVLKDKLQGIEDTSCYFETVYAIARPDGFVCSFSIKNHGYIDTELFDQAFTNGYPLSAVFKANGRDKTWMQMSDSEKAEWDVALNAQITQILSKIIE